MGGVHVVSAVIGLATGAFVLLTPKGTGIHKKIGNVFAVALLLVNLSAAFIYDFNDGKISVFHWLIPVSLFFLIYGMLPMMSNKKPRRLNRHIIGMNGAALGLWAAGATEYFVREMAFGMNRSQLILWSFLISVPFAILITLSITYHLRKLRPERKKKKI